MTTNSQNSSDNKLDQLDIKILDVLKREGRISITDLARRVGLSITPCQVRFKRLHKEGYILGFQAVLNPQKLEQDHVAFTEIKLGNTTEKALEAFNSAVREIIEVETCHMIAGQYDYLLKIRTRDIKAYRQLLGQQVSALPYVASTSTYVSMQAVIEPGH